MTSSTRLAKLRCVTTNSFRTGCVANVGMEVEVRPKNRFSSVGSSANAMVETAGGNRGAGAGSAVKKLT
jgi:hypothetical protein